MSDQKKDMEADPRILFLSKCTTMSLRLKADKWPKLLANHEHMNTLNDFFTKPELPTLVFSVRDGGMLVPCIGFPPNTKTKSVYFSRTSLVEITEDNVREVLTFGDIHANPIEELSVLMEEVVTPILSNPKNRVNWPKCVADDVLRQVNNFRETILEVRGKVLGHTLLPMPIGVEMVAEHAAKAIESKGKCVDLQFKSAIEGAVIKWVHLIEEVIRDDAVKPIAGVYPGPITEIEFWDKRRKNLENLYEQMCETRIQKMAMILEVTKSAYYSSYDAFFTKVVAGVTEAREVTAYLRPFTRLVTDFESVEFPAVNLELEAIMHCICIMYSRSKYYALSQRVLGFLKMFSNSVVSQCIKFLDPSSVFNSDPEEIRFKIQQCLDMLWKFWKMVKEYQIRLPDYFSKQGKEPKIWNFHMKVAFSRVLRLIDRLQLIQDLLATVVDLMKLDRVIFGGIQGRALTTKVDDVLNDFLREWGRFASITYDPLEPDCNLFVEDLRVFQKCADYFDRRLSAIFALALDECFDAEGIFKEIVMMGSLAMRPLIRADVEIRYLRGIQFLDNDLELVKMEYDAKQNPSAAPLYFPPTATIVSWLATLRGRVVHPFHWLEMAETVMLCVADLSMINEKKMEMLDLLFKREERAVVDFCADAPIQADIFLNQPLLIRTDNPDSVLDVNYNPGLVAILKELRFLKWLGDWTLPVELIALRERDDELFMWAQTLNELVGYYNHIKLRARPVELALIESEVQVIDAFLDDGMTLFNWASTDAGPFITNTRLLIKKLYQRVVKAQADLKKMHQLMFQWRDAPLHVRSNANILSLSGRLNRLAVRNKQIADAGQEVHDLLKLNYHLLLDMPIEENLDENEQNEFEEDIEDGEYENEETGIQATDVEVREESDSE